MCHDTHTKKSSSSSCTCQQNWPQVIWRCHHLSHLIGTDETVLANHILPFILPPPRSRGQLRHSTTPCWTATGTHPGSRNKREQIWIFYFGFIEVIIYFFIVPLPMCVGKCFVFYMPPSPFPNVENVKKFRDTVCEMSGELRSIIWANSSLFYLPLTQLQSNTD